jgi:hypothetical protein
MRPPVADPLVGGEPLLLYEGAMALQAGSERFDGVGQVTFRWRPSPAIRYRFASDVAGIPTALDPFADEPADYVLSEWEYGTDIRPACLDRCACPGRSSLRSQRPTRRTARRPLVTLPAPSRGREAGVWMNHQLWLVVADGPVSNVAVYRYRPRA